MATVAELGRRRPPRDRGELETKVRQLVAAGLMEEPAEGPCYVKNPDDERMPAGWFMRPDSSTTPIFLGTNVFRALAALERTYAR